MLAVIDTNCLLASIPPQSTHYWLYLAFNKQRKFDWLISNEILTEYEEKLNRETRRGIRIPVICLLTVKIQYQPKLTITSIIFQIVLPNAAFIRGGNNSILHNIYLLLSKSGLYYLLFPFLFLLSGDKKYHIVWETLNSEVATYIWHFEKSMDALRKGLTDIEAVLTKIKTTGKQDYLSKGHDNFNRVTHDYSDVCKKSLYSVERNDGGKIVIK